VKNSNSNTIQLDLHQTYRPNEKIGVHFVQMDTLGARNRSKISPPA